MNDNAKVNIKSIIILLGLSFILLLGFFSIKRFSKIYNEYYSYPRNVNGTIDCSKINIKKTRVNLNLNGDFEFFYNKWIVSENYDGAPDTIVSVPHRHPNTIVNGKKITSEGYSSYRMYIKGFAVGTKIKIVMDRFVGGYRAFLNKELVTGQGTMVKTGNSKTTGAIDFENEYVVKDNKPIELVMEISSNCESGLHAVPWVMLRFNVSLHWLCRNCGLVLLGVMIALCAFSIAMNFGFTRQNRHWTFSLLLLVLLLQLIFSIDVYWRLCEAFNLSIFNIVIDANYFLWLLLIFSFLLHFVKTTDVKYGKRPIIINSISYFFGTILFYYFKDLPQRMLVILAESLYTIFAVFPVAKSVVKGNKQNILYLILVEIGLLSVIFTFFDFLDVIVFGLDVFESIAATCCAIIIIIMYWSVEKKNSLRVIHSLLVEEENRKIRTEALRAQIKPHFIFNSLTSIQSLYNQNKEMGNEALTRFSKHLRTNVEAEGKDLISFREELNNILNYAELENMRKQKKINLLLDCEEYDFLVPILSLQPFIENSFKYSAVEEKEDGYVEIKSYKTIEGFIVEINDNGIGFDDKKIKTSSTGLKNAKERIRLISNAEVIIKSIINEGTQILILFGGGQNEDNNNR